MGSDDRTDCRWRRAHCAFLADIGNADRCAAVIQSGRQSEPAAKYTSIFYRAKHLGLWQLDSGGACYDP